MQGGMRKSSSSFELGACAWCFVSQQIGRIGPIGPISFNHEIHVYRTKQNHLFDGRRQQVL